MLGGFLCRKCAGEHGDKTFWQGMEHMHGLPNLKRDVWKGMTSSRRRPQEQADRRRRRKACLTTSCPKRRKWLWVGENSSTSAAPTIPRSTASMCATLSTVENPKVLEVLNRPQCIALNLGTGVGYNSALNAVKAY